MHEDVPASTCGLNETIALLRVEPFRAPLSNSPSQLSGIDSASAAASQYRPVDWAAARSMPEAETC
jgi:hypothetical protein